MHELHEDPNYEDVQTCHLFTALEAAMQISKRKVVVGPNDAVGIMMFNTVSSYALVRVMRLSLDLCSDQEERQRRAGCRDQAEQFYLPINFYHQCYKRQRAHQPAG